MRKYLTVFFFPLILLFFSGCIQDGSSPEIIPIPSLTVPSTPTLAPGLPTPSLTPEADASADVSVGQITPTGLPTTAPTAEPTETPVPAARLGLGLERLAVEDFDGAVDHFLTGLLSNAFSGSERQQALYGLGMAQLGRGFDQAAVDAFSQLLSSGSATQSDGVADFQSAITGQVRSVPISNAYYQLGKIYEGRGDCRAAVQSFEKYLESNPELGPYILPETAACYVNLGDSISALTNYELAVTQPALPGINTSLRLELARKYLESDEYEEALNQYQLIADLLETEQGLGMANYLIGSTHLALGNFDEGYEHYRQAVENYPDSFESYLALSALIEIGEPVDDYTRGVVDYYAEAYEPAIAALTRYLEAGGEHNEDAHLFLAWSYEGLGGYEAALNQMDAYIQAVTPISVTNGISGTLSADIITEAASGWVNRAKLQARSGNLIGAMNDYQSLIDTYPDSGQAPFAAWWIAAYADRLGQDDKAVEGYRFLADSYPDTEDAAEALFRAGYLAFTQGDQETASDLWQQAVEEHPDEIFGAASLVWLIRNAGEDSDEYLEVADTIAGNDYYQFRAQHLADDVAPFAPAEKVLLSASSSEREAADEWIRRKMDLSDEADISSLSPDLAQDGRLVRGTKLWQIGRRQEAKAEFENLRHELSDDLLGSYQLSIYLQDLGLYRSSILAAMDAIRLAGVDITDAPAYIAKLAFPINYAGLVAAEAEKYGYDPLLQFALIRQESLFESFATSYAAAQGLSQVIPDTGAYIAERLAWPNYRNEDLYKPYVGIAFGAYYIDQQLDSFEGDAAAALSAYNGGPGNAARWFEQAGHDIDLYREIVDFAETRQYIDRIYEGHSIYRHLYGR